MSPALPKQSVREQIRHAVDPDEKMLPILTSVGQHPVLPSWMVAVNSELDTQWRALATHGEAMEALMGKIEDALTELVPRGWAVFNMQSEEVERAVTLVKADRGGEADELLADQWESSTYRTKRVCDRVTSMGSAEATYRSMFIERARLLHQARSQHDRGEYAASIQMVHSQIEGIPTDVTANKKVARQGRLEEFVRHPEGRASAPRFDRRWHGRPRLDLAAGREEGVLSEAAPEQLHVDGQPIGDRDRH